MSTSDRGQLASDLAPILHRLNHLADLHHHSLRGDNTDVHLSDAIGELAAVALELDPDLCLDDADQLIFRPPQRLGPIEGFALLRRHVIEGETTSPLIAADAGPTAAVIVVLDDGGVGWRAPELGKLDDDQLAAFRSRLAELDGLLAAAQARRGR